MIKNNYKQRRMLSASSRGPSNFPPAYKAQPMQTRKFRFRNVTSAANTPVYRASLLSLISVTSNDTATVAFPIQGIRLDRVSIWATSNNSSAVFSTVTLEWKSAQGPINEVSATGNNFTPAHISCVPPSSSLAGFWSYSNSNESDILFEVNTTAADVIIDLEVTYVLADDRCSYGTLNLAPGVATVSYLALDNSNGAGGPGNGLYTAVANKTGVLLTRTPVSPA